MILEGSAQLNIGTGKISKKLEVFYNPAMKFNRDVTLLLLHSIDRKKLNIGLPLEASGVRVIRMMKELPAAIIKHISCNDNSQEAFEKMQEHITLNKVKGKITVTQKDADLFFEESNGFDYIDIDPFGSPNSFLNAAIKRLSRNGILAVTATDTSALTGTYERATLRKYWARPLRNELMHEVSVRILIRCVQLLGTIHDKALTPVYSYARDHYVRVFFRCEKGRKKVDEIIHQHQYLVYDKERMKTRAARVGEIKSLDLYAGPLWTGQLWDTTLAQRIARNEINIVLAPEESKFLNIIAEESKIQTLGFLDLHTFGKRFKIIPKTESVIELLQSNKIHAARTHFSLYGLRTTISGEELFVLVKRQIFCICRISAMQNFTFV